MVPRNSIELQVVHKSIAFHFWGSRFYHMAAISLWKSWFHFVLRRFFSSVHLLWNFFFCGCCFCCCCWCWWWFLFYLCGVWFFIHPPSLLSTLFVFGHHHQLVSWNVCFRHTKTSTHGEHKHAHIQSHSQSHSHISTRSHLHHCECARAVLIEAKIRF